MPRAWISTHAALYTSAVLYTSAAPIDMASANPLARLDAL